MLFHKLDSIGQEYNFFLFSLLAQIVIHWCNWYQCFSFSCWQIDNTIFPKRPIEQKVLIVSQFELTLRFSPLFFLLFFLSLHIFLLLFIRISYDWLFLFNKTVIRVFNFIIFITLIFGNLLIFWALDLILLRLFLKDIIRRIGVFHLF